MITPPQNTRHTWCGTLLVTCLLAACGQQLPDSAPPDSSPADPFCDPSLYSLGPIPSRHGSTEAPTWLDRGVDFVRPEGGQVVTQFWLPWDINDQQLYVVEPGTSVYVRLRSMLGLKWPGAVFARLLVFVDGRQVSVMAADRATDHLDFTIADGLDDRTVTVPGDGLHSGLNHVQLFIHYFHEAVFPLTTSFPLTVLVGEVPTVPNQPDTVLSTGRFEPGFAARAWWTHPSLGELQFFLLDFLPYDGKSLPIRLTLQPHPDTLLCGDDSAYDKFALVAALDGKMFPLGADGRLIATLREGDEREAHVSLELPKDGAPHEFLILQLSGLGRPARLKGGRLFPYWVPPVNVVSLVRWQ